jgi:hypothetical protein
MDGHISPLKQSNQATFDILPIILTPTQGSVLDPKHHHIRGSVLGRRCLIIIIHSSNNNRGRPPHHHNTRFLVSLTSQDNLIAQDTLCAHCGIQHPAGDCPTAVEDATPSPIRRVAQVQQQVEQVIQRELDTLHVFY